MNIPRTVRCRGGQVSMATGGGGGGKKAFTEIAVIDVALGFGACYSV